MSAEITPADARRAAEQMLRKGASARDLRTIADAIERNGGPSAASSVRRVADRNGGRK